MFNCDSYGLRLMMWQGKNVFYDKVQNMCVLWCNTVKQVKTCFVSNWTARCPHDRSSMWEIAYSYCYDVVTVESAYLSFAFLLIAFNDSIIDHISFLQHVNLFNIDTRIFNNEFAVLIPYNVIIFNYYQKDFLKKLFYTESKLSSYQ